VVDEAGARDDRRVQLTGQLFDLELHIESLGKWSHRDDVSGYFAMMCIFDAGEKVDKIRRELNNIKLSLEDHKDKVTDDMIQQAREVDVSTVIEFTRGKAVAFCHDDNNPSMFHAKRKGLACCPVCNRYFDAIQVLMDRDGLPFFTAVKQLIGGY